MLEIKNVSKSFKIPKKGMVHAVNNVSFMVKPGKIFGLLGPNGAGKTTMLRMIATIFAPSKGDIFYNNTSIYEDRIAHKRKLGFISGNTGIYDRLTPKETIFYFGRLNEVPDTLIKERFEKIVELLDMGNILGKFGGKLSTGEKQKVSIGRMMINDPEILILDEPTLGLDVITSRTIVGFINESRKEGKIIILSTHILSEAEYLCEDIGIIHKGEMVYSGDIEKIHNEYPGQSLENIFLQMIGVLK